MFCLPADEKVGPGDRYIAQQLGVLGDRRVRTPVVAIATKADLVAPAAAWPSTSCGGGARRVGGRRAGGAASGYQVGTLADVLVGQLPPGPALYPDG